MRSIRVVNISCLRLFLFSCAQSLVLILLSKSSKSPIRSRVEGGEGVGANFKFLLSTNISSSKSVWFDKVLMYVLAFSICLALCAWIDISFL